MLFMHVAIMSCCNPCAGRLGGLAARAGGGGQQWGRIGKEGGDMEVNNRQNSFSFSVERDGCSEPLSAFRQAGRPLEI